MANIIDTIFMSLSDFWIFFTYAWPFLLLIWLWALKLKWKSWPIEAVIIERRGDNLIKSNDRAGKYLDKFTGLLKYRLLKAKDTLPVINYDWLLHNVVQYTTFFDRIIYFLRGNVGTLFLFRYGVKQYKPIAIKNNNQRKLILKELKDKNGQPILIKVYEQFDPRKHLGALEFEVIDWDNMNFMVQEQRASFERRQKEGKWLKEIVVPLVIIIVTALVAIIMIHYGYSFAVNLKGSEAPQKVTEPVKIPIISNLIPPA